LLHRAESAVIDPVLCANAKPRRQGRPDAVVEHLALEDRHHSRLAASSTGPPFAIASSSVSSDRAVVTLFSPR
jgi:hypothetical protein